MKKKKYKYMRRSTFCSKIVRGLWLKIFGQFHTLNPKIAANPLSHWVFYTCDTYKNLQSLFCVVEF